MFDALTEEDRARLLSEFETVGGPRTFLLAYAWQDHQEEQIPALVDYLWSPVEALEARRLWARLGLKEWSQRPPRVPLDPRIQLQWQTLTLELEGRLSEAIQLARRQNRLDASTAIPLSRGLWSELIPAHAKTPPPAGSIQNGQSAIDAARIALMLRWTGDETLFQQWRDAIGEPGEDSDAVGDVLMALGSVGRHDDALALALEKDPDEAYEVLLRQSRIEQALACIGIPKLDEASVLQWTKKIHEKEEPDQLRDTLQMQRMAEIGCLFSRLGLRSLASVVDRAAIQRAIEGGGEHRSDTHSLSNPVDVTRQRWKTLFDTWASQHRRPFALLQLKKLLQEGIDEELRDALLQTLFEPSEVGDQRQLLAAPILLWARQCRDGQWDLAVDDVDSILNGREPRDWPVNWRSEGLVELGRSLLDTNSGDVQELDLPLALAHLASLHQRNDIAWRWMEIGAEANIRDWIAKLANHESELSPPPHLLFTDNSPSNVSRLALAGELLARERRYSQAIAVFEQLYQWHPERIDLALRQVKWMQAIGEHAMAHSKRLQALATPLNLNELRMVLGGLDKEELYDECELLLRHVIRLPHFRKLNEYFLTVQLTMNQHAKLTRPVKRIRSTGKLAWIWFVRPSTMIGASYFRG